jgi:hypothetical protein
MLAYFGPFLEGVQAKLSRSRPDRLLVHPRSVNNRQRARNPPRPLRQRLGAHTLRPVEEPEHRPFHRPDQAGLAARTAPSQSQPPCARLPGAGLRTVLCKAGLRAGVHSPAVSSRPGRPSPGLDAAQPSGAEPVLSAANTRHRPRAAPKLPKNRQHLRLTTSSRSGCMERK